MSSTTTWSFLSTPTLSSLEVRIFKRMQGAYDRLKSILLASKNLIGGRRKVPPTMLGQGLSTI
jgi:hypothetical protein